MEGPRVVEVVIRGITGDSPAPDRESADVVQVMEVRLNGIPLPYSKASLRLDSGDLAALRIDFALSDIIIRHEQEV